MTKLFFKMLVKINNILLPSLYKKDPMQLTNFEKVILGYKYWTLTHSLN